MGFLDKILGSTQEKKEELWFQISSTQDADGVISASKEKTQVIFKHSGSCGVSFFAKKNLLRQSILVCFQCFKVALITIKLQDLPLNLSKLIHKILEIISLKCNLTQRLSPKI